MYKMQIVIVYIHSAAMNTKSGKYTMVQDSAWYETSNQ